MKYEYDLTNYDANSEFFYIMEKYILPLMGMVKDPQEGFVELSKYNYEPKAKIDLFEGKLFFVSSLNSKYGFKIDVSKNFQINFLNVVRSVFEYISKVTFNNFSNGAKRRHNNVKNITDLDVLYKNAVQKGIIDWLFSSKKERVRAGFARFLDVMEDWSKKTYEGKKVPYAFVISLDDNNNDGLFYLDFLQDEYSATLSDGINSIIELDCNLNFLDYHSITKDNKYDECNLSTSVPYRFAQVITQYTGDKIGVFLLVSGDIFIVKNKKIELVKREGTWLNFNQEIFINILEAEFNIDNCLIESIYATSLDVSFSHGGGIIAIVDDINDLRKNNVYEYLENNYSMFSTKQNIDENMKIIPKSILDYIDDLTLDIPDLDKLKARYPLYFKNEKNKFEKRFTKRNIIIKLLSGKKFFNLDRKLRTELVSMDGATILNKKGDILAVGAIIQNESGSYGGGRGAAAKRLSKYGMAIKISTDGYIEVYINENLKYKIK